MIWELIYAFRKSVYKIHKVFPVRARGLISGKKQLCDSVWRYEKLFSAKRFQTQPLKLCIFVRPFHCWDFFFSFFKYKAFLCIWQNTEYYKKYCVTSYGSVNNITRRVINIHIYSSIQNNLKSLQRWVFLLSNPFYAFANSFCGELADWPLGRSGGSQAWWWGPRWPPRRGRHTPTRRHASCGTGRPSPSGNSSLDVRRRGQSWS